MRCGAAWRFGPRGTLREWVLADLTVSARRGGAASGAAPPSGRASGIAASLARTSARRFSRFLICYSSHSRRTRRGDPFSSSCQ
jgi:hypothetical protein